MGVLQIANTGQGHDTSRHVFEAMARMDVCVCVCVRGVCVCCFKLCFLGNTNDGGVLLCM